MSKAFFFFERRAAGFEFIWLVFYPELFYRSFLKLGRTKRRKSFLEQKPFKLNCFAKETSLFIK